MVLDSEIVGMGFGVGLLSEFVLSIDMALGTEILGSASDFGFLARGTSASKWAAAAKQLSAPKSEISGVVLDSSLCIEDFR